MKHVSTEVYVSSEPRYRGQGIGADVGAVELKL